MAPPDPEHARRPDAAVFGVDERHGYNFGFGIGLERLANQFLRFFGVLDFARVDEAMARPHGAGPGKVSDELLRLNLVGGKHLEARHQNATR